MLKKEYNNDKIIANVNLKKDKVMDLIEELKISLNDKIFEKDEHLFNKEIIEISQNLDKLIIEYILNNDIKNENLN